MQPPPNWRRSQGGGARVSWWSIITFRVFFPFYEEGKRGEKTAIITFENFSCPIGGPQIDLAFSCDGGGSENKNTDSSFFLKVTKDGFSEEELQDREEGPDYATLLELDSETKNPLRESTHLGNSSIAVGQRPGLSQTISHAL